MYLCCVNKNKGHDHENIQQDNRRNRQLDRGNIIEVDGSYSRYLRVFVEEETETEYREREVKIRVSDHPGKRSNNDGVFTLSFIIDRNRCGHGYDRIDREWEVIDTEDLLTDTYEYVRDIIEWELNNLEVK